MKGKGLKPGQLQKMILRSHGDIRSKFWKELSNSHLIEAILNLLSKGISPVFGAVTRLQKYSQNYIDVIQGKARFIGSKGGGSVRIEAPKSTGMKVSKRGKVTRGKEKTHLFEKGLGVGKKISPVSMKVSGEMYESLKFNRRNGFIVADHERWVFHNEGMGKLPVRRLLPNREGETFNRTVQNKITEALIRATGNGNRGRTKKFFKIDFKIK